MAEEYKIELGVKLKDGDLRTELTRLGEKDSNKVKVGVDLKTGTIRTQISDYNKNTNNAKLKLRIKLDTSDLKEQIRKLNLNDKNTKGASIPFNTDSLDASLRELKEVIAEIKTSFNSLDSGDMKSLLSSVNQIVTALGKAENESDSLVKSLSALSKKDFSINLGIDMNKKGLNTIGYGRAARKQVIPELESQIKYLENLFGGQQAAMSRLLSQGKNVDFDVFTGFDDFNSDSAIKKMEAMEKYISALKKLASIDNVNLDGFNNTFSSTASELINDITGVDNAVDKASDIPQKIKNLFGSSVDGENLTRQLDSVVTNLGEIKTAIQGLSSGISIDGLTQSFDRLSDTIEKLVQNCTTAKKAINDSLGNAGSSVGNTGTGIENLENDLKQTTVAAEQTSDAIRETVNEAKKLNNISIDISDGDVNDLKNALKNIKIDDTSIENTTKELNELNIVAKSVSGTLRDGNLIKWDIKGIQTTTDGLERAVTITKTLGKEGWSSAEKYSQAFDKIANAAEKAKAGLADNGANGFEYQIENMRKEAEKFVESSTELREALNQLDTAFDAMNTANEANDTKALANAYNDLEKALKQVDSQLTKSKQIENDTNAAKALQQEKAVLNSQMETWLRNNTRAAKDYGDEIRKLQVSLNNLDANGVKEARRQFNVFKQEAKSFEKTGLTAFDSLKKKAKEYATYFSAAELFMYAEEALRSMFEQVKLIDSAMTELKKVTDETDESYNRFLTNAASRAREIGTTIDGLVESTAAFARLGYGFKDAQGLAEVANIYAVVGDEVEGVEGATESLISTMAAFKDEVNGLSDSDFAMSIVDKMNEVANRYSITSGGLGEALQRSASSMSAAQNTLDETIALTTAANEVVQNPEKVGNAMKTISMRIRSAKTEMEEAGIETDGMVESTAKLRSEIMALSGVDIMASATEFKSTYAILDELSKKWEHLSDISQATIIELMAGKHQGNIFASLMQNFDTARSALETSLNSAGSAMKEHEKWQQSLEARILSLKASWQGLSQAFLSSNFLKTTLEGITALVDGITKLIDTFGTIPTLLGLFASFKGLTNLPKFLTRLSSLTARTGGMTTLQNVVSALSRTFPGATKGVSLFTKAIKGLFTAMATHPVIAAAVIAVTALTAAFTYQKKEAEELAEEVETLTSKYKEQHEETQKLKNDYDTSSESSMISKYAKLSKGVDSLGKNVSLTADEYSEYQDIVSTIADQFPSLITGYDEQGNALLSCKGNVEALTEAYEKLVHTQNQEILSTNAADIQKNWENTLSQANGYDFLEKIGNIFTFDGIFGGTMDAYDMKTDTAEWLSKLTSDTSIEEIKNYLNKDWGTHGAEITQVLQNAGYDVNRWSSISKVSKVLKEALEKEPHKIQNILDGYYAEFDESIATYKTKATALLSEAFDVSSDISGLNYGNISEELQNIAYQTVNSLDFDFLNNLTDSGKTIDQWVTEMLNQLNAISKEDNAQIEAAFDLQTQFNGGEISYGEYVKSLKDVQTTIGTLNLKGKAKEQLEISLGLDDDGVIDQYNALVKRLTDSKNYDFNISENEAKKLLDGLSSEELAVAVDVITDLSNNNYSETAEEIKTAIERELSIQGLSIELDLEVEKTKLESLSNAINESFSGSGLSEESISAVEGIFSGLNSYDPSKLFERTAHGIRLNSDELRRLNSDYKNTNVSELNKEMDSLGDIYNQTREELYRLTYGTDEYNDKAAELSGIESRIHELEQLAAGYEGVASAYQEWQMMESAGSQRDMYENIIAGFETIDDEIKRGWYDDGTIEFLELLSGKDLSTAGIEEVKKAYKGLNTEIENTGYTVRDFFTVDEDGNSTNTGVYNFLKVIDKLEKSAFGGKDVVKRDRKTNKIIGFDFQVVGGDEVIAETLGISEELVQIMVRAADDAGFVVSMDGTYQQLDILKEKAQEAAESLNRTLEKSGKNGFDFNFNTSDVDNIKKQLSEAQKILDTFRNTDGTINTELEGADEALTVASTLQSMLDKLTRPAYMDIEVSNVEDELQEPLRNLQEYRRLIETQNQLKLSGADTTELEASIEESKDKIVDDLLEIQETNPKLAANIEIKGLTREEIEKKVEAGEITIPATVDIQLEMDEKLGILVDKALLDAGIIDGKEFEKRVDIYLNADVNNEDAKSKTEQAVNEITGSSSRGTSSGNGKSSDGKVDKNVDVDVKADKVDTSDIKNKTEEAVKDESSEKLAVETTVELETTIDEALDLIEKFEDKDITIDVKVKGLDSVKELNQNIDLATKIDGSVDKLSEFVEGAKALSKLDDNISTFVTAEIKGNVIDKSKANLNDLQVFADGAEALQDVESKKVDIEANVEGNAIGKFEANLNDLEVFAQGAKTLQDVEDEIDVTVKANVEGNIVGDADTAGKWEFQINNLETFAEGAKSLADVEDVDVTVKARIDTGDGADAIHLFEEQIDNLEVFAKGVKALADVNDVDVTATARINNTLGFGRDKGFENDVTNMFEEQLDNLSVFAEGIKDLQGLNDVDVTATARINTTIGGNRSNGTETDVTSMFEEQLDNLSIFAQGVEDLQSLGDVDVTATARINNTLGFGSRGNGTETDVTNMFEEQLDNLQVFAKGVESLQGLSDVDVTATARINTTTGFGGRGNGTESDVTGMFEEQLDNLQVFADGVRALQGLGDVSSTVTARVNTTLGFGGRGNGMETDATNMFEEQLDNLKVFADGAKAIQDIGGNPSSTVTARINTKIGESDATDPLMFEGRINNLNVFADAAKSLKGVEDVSTTITAKLNTEIGGKEDATDVDMLGRINNLTPFASAANSLKGVGDVSTTVTAKADGNAITGENASTYLSSLTELKSLISGMTNQTVNVSVTATVDSENVNSAINLLKKVSDSGVFKEYKATVQVGATITTIDDTKVQNYKTPPKKGKVSYSVDENSKVYTWTAPEKDGVVNYSAEVDALTDAQKHKTGTITYKAKISGFPVVNGTANANGSAFVNGTSGKAYKQGDWGVKKTTTALTGELGQELVVYKNRFWTVGDNGAEFTTIPKGAIVFNHKQTEELFANGKVTSDGGRGRVFANGTAFVEGTAYSSGENGGADEADGNSVGSSSTENKFEDTIDWIETILDRADRAIDKYEQQADNVYKTWTKRNKALEKEIAQVNNTISLYEQARNKYLSEAKSVGLSESYAKKVRNGSLSVEDFDGESDEKLVEKIKNYEELYNKYLDCVDAIEELKEQESSLYAKRVEDVSARYEGILSVIEHEKNMLEEYVSQSESQGWLVSANYYNALASNERKNIAQLKKEKADMLVELQTAMESGTIDKNSESWYEMVSAIDEITLSITEGETKFKEYSQTIQQLSWETFDLLQEKISAVTEEADFLIELMSGDKLHDDNGQLTDDGMAIMGLHGQNYNAYMYQADLAAKESERLRKQLASDPYDTELEERYREMITLQQEYILAAEDEKKAIRDLVEEGISLELDALQEKIDLYNEALESQRDLYEYSKKVEEQTKEIASLEKQMAAYQGDNSEEAKAKIQELKVSLEEAKSDLEETEYDKYISDQEKLLDNLYLEYEEILNMRLENVDALITDMIAQINADASSISATISEKAEFVGYTLSNQMTSIWDTNSTKINNVITTYGDEFSTAQTTTNDVLGNINTDMSTMISQLNKIANTNAKSAANSSAANSKQANTSKASATNNNNNNKNNNSSTPTIKVGGKINAGSAQIYDYAGDTSGERQLYRNDPIYTVLSEKNGYILTRWHKLSSGYTGWFKKSDVKALATGARKINSDDVAWTQEQGQEYIVRPSDGAILTPVAKGDSVLTSAATNNIWQMANNPAEFIKNNLSLGVTNVPNNQTVQNGYNQTIENVVFSMPNVRNYDELITQMQRDPNFERLVEAMSIGKLAGKSSLTKGKAIR